MHTLDCYWSTDAFILYIYVHTLLLYIYTHTVYLHNTYAKHRCTLIIDPTVHKPVQPARTAPTRTLFKPPPHPHLGFHCHLLRHQLPPQELCRHCCCCLAPSVAVRGSDHPPAPPVAVLARPPPAPPVVAPQGDPRAARTSAANKSPPPPHGSSARGADWRSDRGSVILFPDPVLLLFVDWRW
jgi:hypothetical protein